MLDILCIGEAKIDLFIQIPPKDDHIRLDDKKENLLLAYGRKIEIENYEKSLGGNACNTGVGLARLGKNVGLCAEVGKDEFSSFIINSLENENLNINLLKRDQESSDLSIILNYKEERTILSDHIERKFKFNFQHTTAPIIYLTSLGEDWTQVYEDCLNLIKETNKVLAFNPGTLQVFNRGRLIMDLIGKTDYLFVNREEAEILLFGKDQSLNQNKKDIKKLLFGLKSLGVKNVIITDGLNGSFVINAAHKYFHLPILKVETVEKTGAGDAYTAGFLSAIIEGKGVEEAMVWGGLNSASVIQSVGSQKGLLKKHEILEQINTLAKFKPSSF